MKTTLQPKAWGLGVSAQGELMVGNHGVVALTEKFGTPLHIVNEERLIRTASRFKATIAAAYPGKVSVHYAMKCNSVPAIAQAIRSAGLNVEVMTEFELELALWLGWKPEQVIVNGPCKTNTFLRKCVDTRVRFVIVDSVEELLDLDSVGQERGGPIDILLRVNPDYVPWRMNRGTATGSRVGCAFGLDLKGGEVDKALDLLSQLKNVHLHGFHFHIGTGIPDADDFAGAIHTLAPIVESAGRRGFHVRVLDCGGGLASGTTRELTTRELLFYQAFDRLPVMKNPEGASFDTYAKSVSSALNRLFPPDRLPELILEPGRCIASSNQFLVLTVHRIKNRLGARKWLVTDGGLSTVTMPTFYEYHEVILCNDVHRRRSGNATIIGPACFAGDVVYRNKPMPDIRPGEVIAIMDSGAYFSSLESSFGFPRPAIVAVNGAGCRIIRSRETFNEMTERDCVD